MFSSIAWAQTEGAAAQPAMWEQFLPFVVIFGIFFFLIIRPQQKRAEKHKQLLSKLKRGDSVLTSGGIFGTIEGLTDQFVTLQVADGVKIRVLRSQIAGMPEELEKK